MCVCVRGCLTDGDIDQSIDLSSKIEMRRPSHTYPSTPPRTHTSITSNQQAQEEDAKGAMAGEAGKKFRVDPWERQDDAGRRSFGTTCVLEGCVREWMGWACFDSTNYRGRRGGGGLGLYIIMYIFWLIAGRRDLGLYWTIFAKSHRGSFIEKGAVSVSVIRGVLSKERAAAMSARCVRFSGPCLYEAMMRKYW